MNRFKVGDVVRRHAYGSRYSRWARLGLGLDKTYVVKAITNAGKLKLGVGEIAGWSPSFFTLVNSQIEEYI